MALYKNPNFIGYSDHAAFDGEHSPGIPAPLSGIYRCMGCGREVVSLKDDSLPPQNHHQHSPGRYAVAANCVCGPHREIAGSSARDPVSRRTSTASARYLPHMSGAIDATPSATATSRLAGMLLCINSMTDERPNQGSRAIRPFAPYDENTESY
jgi:hypothetical protein